MAGRCMIPRPGDSAGEDDRLPPSASCSPARIGFGCKVSLFSNAGSESACRNMPIGPPKTILRQHDADTLVGQTVARCLRMHGATARAAPRTHSGTDVNWRIESNTLGLHLARRIRDDVDHAGMAFAPTRRRGPRITSLFESTSITGRKYQATNPKKPDRSSARQENSRNGKRPVAARIVTLTSRAEIGPVQPARVAAVRHALARAFP